MTSARHSGREQGADLGQQSFLSTASRLGPRDWLSVFHVLFLAVALEVALRLLGITTVAKLYGLELGDGASMGAARQSPAGLIPIDLSVREKRRLGYVRGLMKYWPLGRGTCLRESVLIGHVIRRHDPTLFVGVGKRDGRIVAHAWLNVGGWRLGDHDGFRPFQGPPT